MKNAATNIKEKLVSRYLDEDIEKPEISKRSNINVLLNRIELNKKVRKEKSYIFRPQHLQA